MNLANKLPNVPNKKAIAQTPYPQPSEASASRWNAKPVAKLRLPLGLGNRTPGSEMLRWRARRKCGFGDARTLSESCTFFFSSDP